MHPVDRDQGAEGDQLAAGIAPKLAPQAESAGEVGGGLFGAVQLDVRPAAPEQKVGVRLERLQRDRLGKVGGGPLLLAKLGEDLAADQPAFRVVRPGRDGSGELGVGLGRLAELGIQLGAVQVLV